MSVTVVRTAAFVSESVCVYVCVRESFCLVDFYYYFIVLFNRDNTE